MTSDELDGLVTEIFQLRLECSQYEARQREKERDARELRKYSSGHKASGMAEAYGNVVQRLEKIIRDYELRQP